MKKIVYPWHEVSEHLAQRYAFKDDEKVKLDENICVALSQGKIAQRYESGLPRSPEQLLCLPYAGSRCPYVSEQDVNSWLKEYAPLEWIPSLYKRSKMQEQEKLILDTLRSLGHNPCRLPTAETGVAGVKKKVKDSLSGEALFQGKTVFNKAWDRLRGNREIS
jgi:hypothetical protein|tara:strand:- start:391 stop:879 length:489 start_codon:yes stop_codon:yes gene_type:complete